MPTLADLKVKHPEWCFNCGYPSRPGECQSPPSPLIAALIAKALEDEAATEDLRNECISLHLALKSEREAHEVTKKALQEIADRGPNGRVDYPRASDFMDSGGHVDEDYEAYGFAYANWCEQQTSDIAKAALAREEARKKEVKG